MLMNKSPREESLSQNSPRRSEQAGIFHFLREMGSALIMALIAIVYVIQAFKIPTPSMERSLLVGDFLLGLKFIYGAPLVPFALDLGISQRFPAITDPKPGDVVIFKYPGADRKDYIKRCVAGPGSTVEVIENRLIVNGNDVVLPPRGYNAYNGHIGEHIAHFKPLRIPAKGDRLKPSELPTREFLFCKHLIHQENPRAKIRADYQLYINGEFANNERFTIVNPINGRQFEIAFNNIDFETDDWTKLEERLTEVRARLGDREIDIRKMLFLNDKPVTEYTVKFDNYFMMGDNRDNSLDSRFWGYLNRNYVKAKAFILYFSLDKDVPLWQLPLKIRWNRIGKLIRSWDGGVQAAAPPVPAK
jgi:signal peptidase I